jgi:hypothetical protein
MKTNKLISFILIAGFLLLTACTEPEREMLVTTGTVTTFRTTTASITGEILDLGDGIMQYGHCWSAETNPEVNGTKTALGIKQELGVYTSNLTSLNPGTKYYVRAYCSRGKETVYGNEINFTTASIAVPVLTTTSITDITTETAVGGGNITDQGGTPVIARGVCWSLATAPSVTLTTKTSDGSGIGTFTSSVTGLTAGTKYYLRAYATNDGGTGYGNEVNFITTSDTPVPPTVTTASISSITSSSAVCGGEVTKEGSSSVTARGICWSIEPNPTINNSTTIDDAGIGSFISSILDLDPGKKYYVRAYATSIAGTSYGNEKNFTTNAVIPTVSTISINSITNVSAASGGNVTSDGGSAITARGVCWNTSGNPSTSDSKTNDGVGTGAYVSTLSNLNPLTLYYVRAYVTNSVGTSYGNELTFTSGYYLPTLSTTSITGITSTSATSGGNITSDGGVAVTARGVCWNTSASPTTTNNKTDDGPGTGIFTSTITGLNPGSVYYVRAYATNSVGTAYGNELTLTATALPATLTTTAFSGVTSSTAASGGNITFDGGALVTARGVCWSTTANPTISDSKTNDGAGTGNFISSIINLNPGTTYYARAYATNSVGSSYGNQISFTTSANVPIITTNAITSITATTAFSGGNITSDGGANVSLRGVCWNTLPNPTTSDNKTINGTGIGSFTSSVGGLSSGTTYYIRAYATNSAGTGYGNEITFTTSLTIPTLTTTSVSSITPTTAISGGNITSDGGAAITVSGVCWSTLADPSVSDNKTTDGTTTGIYSSNMTGLISGTLYYVRAYATNAIGTAYGNQVSFTALFPVDVAENNSLVMSVETQSIVNLESTASLVNGTIYGDKVIWQSNLSDYNSRNYLSTEHPALFPTDVELIFSLSSTGTFSMKAKSVNNPQNVFSTLSFKKYLSPNPSRNTNDTWFQLREVPANFYTNPLQPLVINSPMHRIMSCEFGYLRQQGAITFGPQNYYELCLFFKDNFLIKSGFPKPVFFVFSMIYHNQADYPEYAGQLRTETDRYYQSKFSMAPTEIWDLNFTGKRSFEISTTGVTQFCIFGNAVCDNQNSVYVKVNGVNLAQQVNAINKEAYSFWALTPTTIELGVSLAFALVCPSISYIVCADNVNVSNWNEERNGVINPADSWDQNPKPIIMKIDGNGTTLAK